MHKGAELASRPADFITSKINSGDKDSFTSFFEDGRKVWVGDRAGIFYSIDVRTGLVNRYVLSEIKGSDQQFAGYSGRLCLSQCDRTRYIRI